MLISTLFQTLAPHSKPLRLAADQYEFSIDRKNRRILGAVQGFFVSHETIRIQANRPYTWSGSADLPDTSLGMLRPFRCQVQIEGTLPSSEPKLWALLTMLLQDDYDFDRLFMRALNTAIAVQRGVLTGEFFDALAARHAEIQTAMVATLNEAGLPVERLALRPKQYDIRPSVDLADETDGVTARARDHLQSHRVTYKVRLVWGVARAHKIARLAYDDKAIVGKLAASPMSHPLVEGQVQPLEAYFRVLLAEALAQQSYADVVAGSMITLNAMASYISDKLGRGTGRVVDTLVVYPNTSSLSEQNMRSTRFLLEYDILGISGERLQIAHAIRYALVDSDRWKSQGSPDPEKFLQQEMFRATELFLQNKRFEDVVALYLKNDDEDSEKSGEALLGQAVVARVLPIAASIGYELASSSAIIDIPQHKFVVGTEIDLGQRDYPLADAHLSPSMQIKVTVRVSDGRKFARALARKEDFTAQIKTALDQVVRTTLRSRSGLEYYSSSSVNDVTRPQRGVDYVDQEPSPVADTLSNSLCRAINELLSEQFGLLVEHLYILPGIDPIIQRMKELAQLTIHYQQAFKFRRGGAATAVEMRADADIFIVGLDGNNWASFYQNVPRFATVEAHASAFRDLLEKTLQMIEHALVGDGRAALQTRELHMSVIANFTERIAQQYGLVAKLRPLGLSVYRPSADKTAALLLGSTNEELAGVLAKRAALDETAGTDVEYEREKMTRRIKTLRAEIKELTLEYEADLGATETVQVYQDSPAVLIGSDIGSALPKRLA